MVGSRTIVQAVRGLRLHPESELDFRKKYIEPSEKATLHLWDKDSLRYFIRFRAMSTPLFILQPLSRSDSAPQRKHYCLGELNATLIENKDIEFSTGFLVTKTFPSNSETELWIVQDWNTKLVGTSLPQSRVRSLHGQEISCIQLSSLTSAGKVRFGTIYNSGFLFWPLNTDKMSDYVTEPVVEETIDESRFQHLYHTKGLGGLLLSARTPATTRKEQEGILKGQLDAGELSAFLNRYPKGGQWKMDFQSMDIIKAVQSINPDSTNHELRQVRDLISSRTHESRDLQIQCPDGNTRTYSLHWLFNPERFLQPFDDDRPFPTTERLEVLERHRGFSPEERVDLSPDERYQLPPGTAVTVLTGSGKKVLCMPLARVSVEKRIRNAFCLVRLLETKDFGVVFDFGSIDRDHVDDPEATVWAPQNRIFNFPQTDIPVSIGVLRGLFVDQVATLEDIEATGYHVFDAVRLGGKIQSRD